MQTSIVGSHNKAFRILNFRYVLLNVRHTLMPKRLRLRVAHDALQLGMTLIELMVGMVIIGIILSVAVAGIRNLTEAEMKQASNRLASTIRYLHNKAVIDRLYIRVVYDFAEQSYHIEETTDPFVISPPSPDEEKEKVGGEEEKKVAVNSESGAFSRSEEYLLKPVRLKGDVFFKDVQVSYSKVKLEQGQAYTYFFPNGFATPTIINLRDGDDETHYSLEVLPLSGRVRIESRYRELNIAEE